MKITRGLVVLGLGLVAACEADKDTVGDTDLVDGTDTTSDTEVHDPDGTDVDPTHTDGETDTDLTGSTDIPVDDSDSGFFESDPGPLPVQALLISEVGDYSTDVKYVEICNPGPDVASLEHWSLGRLGTAQGDITPLYDVELTSSVTLAPGEAYLVARDPAKQLQYTDRWGSDALPRQYDANVVFGDGNDPYGLYYDGVLVDLFGHVTAATPWYAGKVAVRNETLSTPSRVYRPIEWLIDAFTNASPGLCLGRVHTDIPLDSFVDTFDSDNSDTFDTDFRHTDEPDVVVPVGDLDPGELVITEVMAAPDSCEYLAFFVAPLSHPTTDYVDLYGLTFSDAGGHTSVIDTHVQVRPGAEVVAVPEGTESCHNLLGAVTYTSFDLDDDGDTIRLVSDAGILDEVVYTADAVTADDAWQLDYGIYDAASNDDPANWCLAFTRIAGEAAFGSPSGSNDDCQAAPVDTDLTDEPVHTDEHTDVPHTDVIPVTPLSDVEVGDLVITEFLAWPKTNTAACATATAFEYIEIYNTTDDRIDLDGLRLIVGATSSSISGRSLIQPGDVAILAPGDLSTHCFANNLNPTTGTYRSKAFSYPATINLPDAGGSFAIANATTTLDVVDNTSWSTPNFQGQAWSLCSEDPNLTVVDPAYNDDEAAWFHGGYNSGPGNVGTMGAVYACAAP